MSLMRLGLERRQVGTSIKLFSLVENSIAVVTWWYLARDEVYFVLYALCSVLWTYLILDVSELLYRKTPSSCLDEAAGILHVPGGTAASSSDEVPNIETLKRVLAQ